MRGMLKVNVMELVLWLGVVGVLLTTAIAIFFEQHGILDLISWTTGGDPTVAHVRRLDRLDTGVDVLLEPDVSLPATGMATGVSASGNDGSNVQSCDSCRR